MEHLKKVQFIFGTISFCYYLHSYVTFFNFITVDIQEEPKETSKKRKRKSLGNQTNEEATQLPESK